MTTVNKTSQHGDITIIEGSRKKVLEALRVDAREKRLESRKRHNLPLNVSSISGNLHPSILVTMASYQFEKLGLYALISVLNGHGVTQYKAV